MVFLDDFAEMLWQGRFDTFRGSEDPLSREYRGSKVTAPRDLPWVDVERRLLFAVNEIPGDDVALALDYRTSDTEPRVVGTDWDSGANACVWREVAPTFADFWSALAGAASKPRLQKSHGELHLVSMSRVERSRMSLFDKHSEAIARFESLLVPEENRTERRQAVEAAIRIAESLVEQNPGDADAYQCLGLAWYHLPGSSSFRSWHCRRALEQALWLDPDHQFARHYLACLAFDQERYRDALELLKDSDSVYFEDQGQEWRALKNEELILVCMLRISPARFPQTVFDSFVDRYRDAQKREDQDFNLGSTVWPQELREHVEWMVATGVSRDDPGLAAIVAFLHRIGYADSFWNAELKRANQPQVDADDGVGAEELES